MTLFLMTLVIVLVYTNRKSEQSAIKTLTSIRSQQVTSFKIHPEKTYTEDYQDAVEFRQEEELVGAFFHAIADSRSYQPQHDRALASWGMQIQTNTITISIGCYIPDLTPDVVVGSIISQFGSGMFQSDTLLRWYQKYGHYWNVGGYQKVQYGRVMAILNSMSPERVGSFSIVSGVLDSSEEQHTHEFVQNADLIMEFFQALEERQFAAPTFQEYLARWTVQIHAGARTVHIECSLPVEVPTVVIGLIDSDAGYTYFQSQKLLQWYQKYRHRWLKPEEAHDTKEEKQEEHEK